MDCASRGHLCDSTAFLLNFLLVIESRDFKVCQKNRLRPILMKLGMMLEVDKTFTTIWLSRSSEIRVKVRRWPQSPIRTICYNQPHFPELGWVPKSKPLGIVEQVFW